MAIRLVLNWDNKNEEYHLSKQLRKYGHAVFQYSLDNFDPKKFSSLSGKASLLWKYWKGARKAVREAAPQDTLIGTNFHVGALISINCLLLGKKNKVLGFNLILNDKRWLIHQIRALFLECCFKNENFFATVNLPALIPMYSKYFLSPISADRFFVLKDHYINPDNLAKSLIDDDYVFTGGENSRDWQGLFRAASLLPDIKFKCIARRRLFPHIEVPANVDIVFDTSYEDFLNMLKRCTLVALPLISDGPAGLLVIFDATFLGKAVITTRTMITENYINSDDKGVLIEMGDATELANSINLLMKNKYTARHLAQNLKLELENNYSVEEYGKKVNDMVVKIAKMS